MTLSSTSTRRALRTLSPVRGRTARPRRRNVAGLVRAPGRSLFEPLGTGVSRDSARLGRREKRRQARQRVALPSIRPRQAAAGGSAAGKPVLEFIRDSIVNPNAYLEPGTRSGILRFANR